MQKRIGKAHPGVSVNDYIVGVLSRRYGHPWTPAGMRSRRDSVGESAFVRLPEEIWIDLKKESVPFSTMSAVIIQAIREDK